MQQPELIQLPWEVLITHPEVIHCHGAENKAGARSSIAMGHNNNALGYSSFAMAGNSASESYSIAMGYYNAASESYSVAMGRYNKIDVEANNYGCVASHTELLLVVT